MSANRERPHVVVIPEDDANRQLAIGFRLHFAVNDGVIDIMPVARGWRKLLEKFRDDYVPYLHTYAEAVVVLLMDFDQDKARRSECEVWIPEDLKARVVVLGSKDEPETLKKELKTSSLEKIGTELAQDCLRDDLGRWSHPHLSDNLPELQRMFPVLKRIVFQGG